MIVDCHTHLWTDARQLGHGSEEYLARQVHGRSVEGGPAEHARASACVDKTLVLGYRSRHLGADVPNELLAEYVAGHGDKMIGIAAVDPTDGDAASQAESLLNRKEFRGLAVSPSAQNFHPADSRAMKVYEVACRRGVPVFFQQGTHFPVLGRMEYARPLLLDEIAGEFPELTMVIGAMGHPWTEECVALLGKHSRVFSDVSALVRRPWQAYTALIAAHQFNVMDKVLFGSDFPFCTPGEAIEAIYRLHEVTQGTNLPGVPREVLRAMVERDALSVLRIARPGEKPVPRREQEE